MNIVITKRDGRIKAYDESRIEVAVEKALRDIGEDKKGLGRLVASSVTFELISKNKDNIGIEEIQDLVVEVLNSYSPKGAISYKGYRTKRTYEREKNLAIKYKNEIIDKFSNENSNANVDENNFGGKQLRIVEAITEAITDISIPKDILEETEKGTIKIHDKSMFPLGVHNCLLMDYPKMLKEKGIETRQGDTKPTKKYLTACQLLPVAIQSQSLDMFGGCGIMNFSIYMVEFLKYSIANHVKQFVDYNNLNIEVDDSISFLEAKQILGRDFSKVKKYIDNEATQAHQSLITNLVTLQSRSGHQLPFSSINIGLIDPDNEEESAYIVEMFLKEIEKGIGKHDRTAIFPITCFQIKSGVNRNPEDKYYYLRLLAQKISHKRLYPTFVNGDFTHNEITSWESEMNMMG